MRLTPQSSDISEFVSAIVATVVRHRMVNVDVATSQRHCALVELSLQVLAEGGHAVENARHMMRYALRAHPLLGFR